MCCTCVLRCGYTRQCKDASGVWGPIPSWVLPEWGLLSEFPPRKVVFESKEIEVGVEETLPTIVSSSRRPATDVGPLSTA